MNPITNVKNQNLMNERELRLGYTGTMSSWHRQYKDSAWIYVGGLHYELTEGDIICVFSQYGEIANINLVRDRKTGVSKGFVFICYEDQRSTVLATDNLNGIKVAGRIIRVDHVEQYRVPKEATADAAASGNDDGDKRRVTNDPDSVADFVREHGCGPEAMTQVKDIEVQQKEADEKEKKRQKEPRKRSHDRRWRDRSDRSPHSGHRQESRDDRSRSPAHRNSQSSSRYNHRSEKLSPPRRRNLSPPSPPRGRKLSPPSPPRRRR